jgi:hypothetical protein
VVSQHLVVEAEADEAQLSLQQSGRFPRACGMGDYTPVIATASRRYCFATTKRTSPSLYGQTEAEGFFKDGFDEYLFTAIHPQ